MDERLRRIKVQELQTWKINLARAEKVAAGQGTSARIETLNEIDTARDNISRVEQELDAGEETSREETQLGLLELILEVVKRSDQSDDKVEANHEAIKELRKRIYISPRQRTLSLLATMVAAATYTMVVIKEARDFLLDNLLMGIVIIFLMLTVAILLWSLSVLVQFGESNGNE